MDRPDKKEYFTAPKWLIRICHPPRIFWLAPLLGFLLSFPSIFSGFQADDHIFIKISSGIPPYPQRAAWDCFNLASTDAETIHNKEIGVFAWWTPESFRFHFYRPITSLLHTIQFRMFGNKPWIMHLGLVLLYALLILLCSAILAKTSTSPAALGIGILLFTINDTNANSVGWITAYNTLLCCIFGFSAFLMHMEWCNKKSFRSLVGSLIAFLLALLSSEGGLAFMGYIVAYALFIVPGTVKNKLATLFPCTILSLGYLLYYKMQQYGIEGSGIYLSPTGNIAGSIFIILKNILLLTVSQILSIPALSMLLDGFGPKGTVIAVILFLSIILIFKNFLTANNRVAFLGTGMILSLLPFTLGPPQDRLLIWSGLGAAGLLGELFTGSNWVTSKLQRTSTRILFITNTAVSVIAFIPLLFSILPVESIIRKIESTAPENNTVVFNAPHVILFWHPPVLRYENGGKWPSHFYTLYAGTDTVTFKRTGNRTLTATTPNGWYAKASERFARSEQIPFHEDDSVNLELMCARINRITPDGRPAEVLFSFKNDLSTYDWMRWTKEGLKKCELPQIGNEIHLFAPLF